MDFLLVGVIIQTRGDPGAELPVLRLQTDQISPEAFDAEGLRGGGAAEAKSIKGLV